MGKAAQGEVEIRDRLEKEGAHTKVDAYELGSEDSYEDGHEMGAEEEREYMRHGGLVVRWSDGKVYAWNGAVLKWEHAPHRWAEALNEE